MKAKFVVLVFGLFAAFGSMQAQGSTYNDAFAGIENGSWSDQQVLEFARAPANKSFLFTNFGGMPPALVAAKKGRIDLARGLSGIGNRVSEVEIACAKELGDKLRGMSRRVRHIEIGEGQEDDVVRSVVRDLPLGVARELAKQVALGKVAACMRR